MTIYIVCEWLTSTYVEVNHSQRMIVGLPQHKVDMWYLVLVGDYMSLSIWYWHVKCDTSWYAIINHPPRLKVIVCLSQYKVALNRSRMVGMVKAGIKFWWKMLVLVLCLHWYRYWWYWHCFCISIVIVIGIGIGTLDSRVRTPWA